MKSFFRWVLKYRYSIVAFYLLATIPSAYLALTKVQQDNSPDRLMIQSDPAYQNHQDFERIFGHEEWVILFFDTPSIWNPTFLQGMDQVEQNLQQIDHVHPSSLLSAFTRRYGKSQSWTGTPAEIEELRTIATSTPALAQGFTNAKGSFFRIQITLNAPNVDKRRTLLQGIDRVLQQVDQTRLGITHIRKVGQPYVNDYLDKDTRSAGIKYFALFGVFVVLLNLFLYRSWRTLLAFLLPLGVSTSFTVGFVGLIGGTFTIVSSLIPMTILITCTATLVYIHSRFVDCPPDVSVEDHQIFSLGNKFLACTASIAATAIGFAALAVSKIRPIREMGLWVAIGLVFTWLVVFTLFPALQKILQTPTQQKRRVAAQWFVRLMHHLPLWSYRYRWLLVTGALLWCIAGVVALFGIPWGHPRLLKAMELETNSVAYINHNHPLYKDTMELEQGPQGGLFITDVWLKNSKESSPLDNALDVFTSKFLHTFKLLEQQWAKDSRVAGITGAPDLVEFAYALTHRGKMPVFSETADASSTEETFTDNVESFANNLGSGLAGSNISLLGADRIQQIQEMLRRFANIEKKTQLRIMIRSKTMKYKDLLEFQQALRKTYDEFQSKYAEWKDFQLQFTGSALLQAQISHHLVPTLTESFGLTVVIIFVTFLVVFRSGAARIMAMIPSLFAILAMFAIMRVTGTSLNIATILIASTVLGSSENDQIHFFYHYQEGKKRGSSTQKSLEHTLVVAGRAILFATLINAGGFLAFALADLPPIRQFGVLSALAFVLSMVADFTALPAALWIVFRDKPDEKNK